MLKIKTVHPVMLHWQETLLFCIYDNIISLHTDTHKKLKL